ncbi:RNA-directed DNA polymerase [Metabacillus indicus]|uniref:RNA-directed DNA polymerase n=1 Tax=Metabacillus indicus TaxID=246786 RepID=UPI003983E0F7
MQTPTISSNTKKPYDQNFLGVPQGLSVSNILANIYMNQLDYEYSQQKKCGYFRYVDDILIICNVKDKEEIEKKLIFEIQELQLNINTEKNIYGYLTDEFSFLGYRFNNKKIGVRKENIYKLEKSLIEVFTKYKYSDFTRSSEFVWSLNLKITGGIIDGKKYGWVFFYSQIDDIEVLYKLDRFIEKQFKRFNINHISPKTIKKFVKAYHEIIYKRSTSKYIPNFDEYTINQKKEFLFNVVNIKNISKLDDEAIEKKFKGYIFKTIKKLDKDIQHIS